MSTVNKIDIDGVQWDIEDQEARDRLDVIERRNTVELKDITQDGCYLQMAKRNGIVDCFITYTLAMPIVTQQVQFTEIFPVGWRPAVSTRNLFVTNNDDTYKGQIIASKDGNLGMWSGVGSFELGASYTTSITFVCAD